MERGKYKQEVHRDPVTLEDIKIMEYCGGGYFRTKMPVGQSAKIIHGPELKRMLLEEITRLEKQVSDAGWALDGYQQTERDNFGREY